jgi:hypothetical protein
MWSRFISQTLLPITLPVKSFLSKIADNVTWQGGAGVAEAFRVFGLTTADNDYWR